jgi:hypothetical protein
MDAVYGFTKIAIEFSVNFNHNLYIDLALELEN